MSGVLVRDYPPEYGPLAEVLGFGLGLNFTPKWAADADFLLLLAAQMTALRPSAVIECSSGMSTLVLARCCERNGLGQVISLENGPEFAANTREALAAYGLEPHVQIVDAPLRSLQLHGEDYQWYDVAGLPQTGAQMLVVDGPPGFVQRHARYPALPLLRDYLDPGASILLDDAARPDEQWMLKRWLAQSPGACFRYTATRRGCGILTLGD